MPRIAAAPSHRTLTALFLGAAILVSPFLASSCASQESLRRRDQAVAEFRLAREAYSKDPSAELKKALDDATAKKAAAEAQVVKERVESAREVAGTGLGIGGTIANCLGFLGLGAILSAIGAALRKG